MKKEIEYVISIDSYVSWQRKMEIGFDQFWKYHKEDETLILYKCTSFKQFKKDYDVCYIEPDEKNHLLFKNPVFNLYLKRLELYENGDSPTIEYYKIWKSFISTLEKYLKEEKHNFKVYYNDPKIFEI